VIDSKDWHEAEAVRRWNRMYTFQRKDVESMELDICGLRITYGQIEAAAEDLSRRFACKTLSDGMAQLIACRDSAIFVQHEAEDQRDTERAAAAKLRSYLLGVDTLLMSELPKDAERETSEYSERRTDVIVAMQEALRNTAAEVTRVKGLHSDAAEECRKATAGWDEARKMLSQAERRLERVEHARDAAQETAKKAQQQLSTIEDRLFGVESEARGVSNAVTKETKLPSEIMMGVLAMRSALAALDANRDGVRLCVDEREHGKPEPAIWIKDFFGRHVGARNGEVIGCVEPENSDWTEWKITIRKGRRGVLGPLQEVYSTLDAAKAVVEKRGGEP
jgi:hypothetical protein